MTKQTRGGLTRRGLLGGLGAGAGMAGFAAISTAEATMLPEPETSETYDVIVIGSGMAGSAAALEAAGRGANVMLLEKARSTFMGGNSMMSAGYFAVPSDNTETARHAYVAEFDRLTSDRGNSEIFALMAAHVTQDLDWLAEHDMETLPFPPSMAGPVGLVFAAPAPLAGMMGLFRTMREQLSALGVTLAFDTKARQLIMEGTGAVAGVRAYGSNGLVDYRANSVIIAAGGYSGNSALLEAYAHPNAGALKVSGIAWASGDGLAMAQAAGAGLSGMGGIAGLLPVPLDPVETTGGLPFPAIPHTVALNAEGKRFADESLGYPFLGGPLFEQPDQLAALVFDETTRHNPEVDAGVGTFARLGLEVHEADTLEEMAGRIGIAVEPFLETIRDFNAAIADGSAPEATPPKASLAHAVETPPFYAFHPIVPGILLTFGGIMINTRAEVLEPDGRVIPGLYAAGEGAGGVFHHGYTTGGSLANCLVMGRIAGGEAATRTG